MAVASEHSDNIELQEEDTVNNENVNTAATAGATQVETAGEGHYESLVQQNPDDTTYECLQTTEEKVKEDPEKKLQSGKRDTLLIRCP